MLVVFYCLFVVGQMRDLGILKNNF